MELLFAVLGGAVLGFIFHYALPGADTRGAALSGTVGAAIAAVVWEALVWSGWRSSDGWMWVWTLVISGLSAAAVCLFSTRARRTADRELLESLFRGSDPKTPARA